MALRIPPGRAGRISLLARLEIAARGAALLDRKRQVLLREQQRLRTELRGAQHAWNAAAEDVKRWTVRAAIVDGSKRVGMLARHAHGHAQVELSWSNLMGPWQQCATRSRNAPKRRSQPSSPESCGACARSRIAGSPSTSRRSLSLI